MDNETKILAERIEKGEKLRREGIDIYPHGFQKTHSSSQLKEQFANIQDSQHSEETVSVAGRLMTFRIMGKASFAHIQDEEGKIQLYFKKDDIGEDKYSIFKTLDMGDIIGATGHVFMTKTGEITLLVSDYKVLTKSLRPLPEKYHGLKDIEIRHRKRYLDLIANSDVKNTFYKRSVAIREIRNYLNEKGYMEVETPILQPQYGGAAARPFITKHNALNMNLYLRISPELYLKRLLVGGFEKVYDINKNFRNEGIDFDHNPEFSMIEWYEAYADYNKMMDMSEELIKRVAENVYGKTVFKFRDMDIDLSGKWERLPMVDAIKKYGNVDVENMTDDELMNFAEKHNYNAPERSRGHLINFLFEVLAEEKIIQPTFIIDHPVEISPLTKKHRSKPGCVERAELFIATSEFANMYSELNDPVEQRQRLEEQEQQRVGNVEDNYPMDEDFCEAIEYGMPPAGGIGIGIDRLIMLLSEQPSIREVILFPTLRPDNK